MAPISDPTLLETKPDARQNPPAAQPDGAAKTEAATPAPPAAAAETTPLPNNRQSAKPVKQKKPKKTKNANQ